MLIKAERQSLPQRITSQMDLYRLGFSGIPADYIRFHARIARVELQRLQKEYGVSVHGEPTLVNDGWMDGMRVITAVVETSAGKLMKLRWHDGNQGFFIKSQASGGSSALFESDLTGKTTNRLANVTF